MLKQPFDEAERVRGMSVLAHEHAADIIARERRFELAQLVSVEFVDLDPNQLADRVRSRVVVDGRNCLDVQKWQQAGWRVHCLGRRVA